MQNSRNWYSRQYYSLWGISQPSRRQRDAHISVARQRIIIRSRHQRRRPTAPSPNNCTQCKASDAPLRVSRRLTSYPSSSLLLQVCQCSLEPGRPRRLLEQRVPPKQLPNISQQLDCHFLRRRERRRVGLDRCGGGEGRRSEGSWGRCWSWPSLKAQQAWSEWCLGHDHSGRDELGRRGEGTRGSFQPCAL